MIIISKPFILTLSIQPEINYRLLPEEPAFVNKNAFAKHSVVVIHNDATGEVITQETVYRQPASGKWVKETVMKNKPTKP